MRRALLILSTVAVSLAIDGCGRTPIPPNLSATKSMVQNDIVGGTVAEPYSWPWQVAWFSKYLSNGVCLIPNARTDSADFPYWYTGEWSLDCGGSVVAPGWVITAGHCVYDDMNANNYKVKAGVFDEAQTGEPYEQVVEVKAIHLHPKYNHTLTTNDIALIELATNLIFSDHVQPICLPKTDDGVISPPSELWITGWGTTTEYGEISRQLKQALIPAVDIATCKREYPIKLNKEVEFCAGKKGVDSCQGDSGGPVVKQSANGSWFQYGIVSWGQGCAEEGEAGVSSRMTAFCDFIETTTNGVVKCQDV